MPLHMDDMDTGAPPEPGIMVFPCGGGGVRPGPVGGGCCIGSAPCGGGGGGGPGQPYGGGGVPIPCLLRA